MLERAIITDWKEMKAEIVKAKSNADADTEKSGESKTLSVDGPQAVLDDLRAYRKAKGVEDFMDLRGFRKQRQEYKYREDVDRIADFKDSHPNDFFNVPAETKTLINRIKNYEKFLVVLVKGGNPNAKKS